MLKNETLKTNDGHLSGNLFALLIIAGIVLNFAGVFNDILEPDGTLYASIAKHSAITNDWINLIGNGQDWLDKPHLPFWITAISFKIFGYTAFAYKIPSFLFWLAGIYYTYLLALKLYNKTVARFAVIIYITALHVILSNFDVRAEDYLTTLIIAATYHVFRAGEYKYSWHILYAALYCACAMMTKGIFVLVTIASGFIFYWILTKQWKEFLEPRWYLMFALSFLFTLPELYCLYIQFDLHPEKIVYGKTNVSGIRFFFWDSQFGRFFNNGPIKGKGNPLFFFHTILWAFLPWSLLLYISVVALFKKRKPVNRQSLIINFAALISFIMFSLSRFQLPYYILIIFPHFAIITANWLTDDLALKKQSRINIMLNIIFFILVLLIIVIAILLDVVYLVYLMVITVAVLIIFVYSRKKGLAATAVKSMCFAFLLSAFLNISFYPTLMQYQSGMQAAKWLNKNKPALNEVTMYKCIPHTSFAFYSNAEVKYADTIQTALSNKKPIIIYSEKADVDSLAEKGFNILVLHSFAYFHTSKLNAHFIMPGSRSKQLQTFELASVN